MNDKRTLLQKGISMIRPLIPYCLDFDMNSIREYSNVLADKVRDYEPDIVVGITMGGLYPAAEICRHLDLELDTVQISRYRRQLPIINDIPGVSLFFKNILKSSEKSNPFLVEHTKQNLEDKKVLLVDDDCNSEKTLNFGKDYLKTKNPKDVKTGVLFKLGGNPDFYATELSGAFMTPWRETSPYYEAYLEEVSKIEQEFL